MAYHRGVTMHKLHVDVNAIGAIFAIAILLAIFIGLPHFRWFLIGAALLGAILSVFINRWHRKHKIEIDDLSSLVESTDKRPKV